MAVLQKYKWLFCKYFAQLSSKEIINTLMFRMVHIYVIKHLHRNASKKEN